MTAVNKDILKHYVRHKESVLSYYDNLLVNSDAPSVAMLIEALKEREAMHKEGILRSKTISEANMKFSDMLALTPVDEFGKLSKIFNEVIEFKERSLQSYFSEIENIKAEHSKDMLETIKTAEINFHKHLKTEKNKCGF